MTNETITRVIQIRHITNAQQLTAFVMGDDTKGVLTPYPTGFGSALWKQRLKILKDFYTKRTEQT